MGVNTKESKYQERIERLKADFYGTAMERTDVDWLFGLPRYKYNLLTDIEEIKRQIETKGKEIR